MIIRALHGIVSDTLTVETPPALVGTMNFNGSTSDYLVVANDADLRMGSGDFTIEWWQYQTDSNAFPRVFSMGTYPSANIGVSLEGGVFYFWAGGSAIGFSPGTFKNQWVHFAVSRSSGTLRAFKNGTQIGSIANSTNFSESVNSLTIGNELSLSADASFGGYLTNFHWVKGTALYTGAFTHPKTPISPVANTKLLLLATTSGSVSSDSSGLNKTVTNTGVSWTAFSYPTM